MDNIKILLGKKIKEIRKRKGYTQEKLADMANIEIPSLSNIENGKNYPNHDTLRRISNALEVKVHELFIFEHLREQDELIDEMTEKMKNDEELTRKMYNFFVCVK